MKKKKKTGGLLAKKPLIRSTPDALPFTVRERKIFAFCDHGAKCVGAECGGCRKVDPMQIAFAIVREGGKTLDTDLAQLSTELPEKVPEDAKAQFFKDMMPVTERIVQLAAKVFGVQLFDGDRGMTWEEIYALFFTFHAYANELQKKMPSQPTSRSPLPTATSANSVTPTSSPSGSTVDAVMPAPPPPSPPESPSPSEKTQECLSGVA